MRGKSQLFIKRLHQVDDPLVTFDEFKKAEFDMQYVINKYIQMFKDVNGNLNKKLLQRNFYK